MQICLFVYGYFSHQDANHDCTVEQAVVTVTTVSKYMRYHQTSKTQCQKSLNVDMKTRNALVLTPAETTNYALLACFFAMRVKEFSTQAQLLIKCDLQCSVRSSSVLRKHMSDHLNCMPPNYLIGDIMKNWPSLKTWLTS